MALVALSLIVAAGGLEAQKSLGCLLCNDPRVLYLMAEYKMAVGDTDSALKLLKASTTQRQAPVPKTGPNEEIRGDRCPYSGGI